MREGSRIRDGTVHQMRRISQVYRSRGVFLGKHVQADFGCGKILAKRYRSIRINK